MSQVNPKKALRNLYVAVKDKPLEPKTDTDLYEPYVEDLPDGDPIHELLTGIEFSEVESLLYLNQDTRQTALEHYQQLLTLGADCATA